MKKLVFGLACLLSLNLWAKDSQLLLTNFSLGGMRYTPQNWQTSTSIDLAYTPTIDFFFMTLRAGLGISFPKDSRQKSFTCINTEIAAQVPIASIFGFEASAGLRMWGAQGGTNPEVGGAFTARIGEFFDRFYIGYAYLMIPGNPTNIFRVGTGFNL